MFCKETNYIFALENGIELNSTPAAIKKRLDNRDKDIKNILRGGAVVARRAHNPKVIGSNPFPATSNPINDRVFLYPEITLNISEQYHQKDVSLK